MFIDGRQSQTGTDYDVVIIGSGPAGITLALELEQSGQTIAILESGGLDFDDDAQMLNDGVVTGLDETDLIGGRLRLLGGTSNHWGGHCLPLDPIDFARRPLSGLSGWTVSYDDMVPFYERAHDYCDLGTFDYDPDAMHGLPDDPWLLPDTPDIENKTILQSTPTRFGEKYHDALKASQTIDVHLWTTATGIDIDEAGTASVVQASTIDGQARGFTARRVVLACGAIENARFLLANNARLGTGFGDAGGLLGKCFMDHTVGGAAFVHFDTPQPVKAYWSHKQTNVSGKDAHFVWRLSDAVLTEEGLNNTQFFVIPLSDDPKERAAKRRANEGLTALKSIAKWGLGRDQQGFKLSTAYCQAIMNADDLAVRKLRAWSGNIGVHRALLRYESEQLPSPDSYVALGEGRDAFGTPLPRLHWSPSIQDRDSIVRSAVRIGQLVGAAGLGRLEMEDHFDDRYWDASTAWHHLGTTRLAENPREGVVDGDLRLHGTQNVYVAGGSVFPSGGRANPTLTIVALSVRLAEHLQKG